MKSVRQTIQRSLLGAALAVAAGCGPSVSEVSGKVSVAGVPVENGGIDFVPLESARKGRVGGPIVGGSYTIAVDRGLVPGKYRVEVLSMAPIGKARDIGEGFSPQPTKQVLPAKFNESSELTAEITSGSNTIDLDLKP